MSFEGCILKEGKLLKKDYSIHGKYFINSSLLLPPFWYRELTDTRVQPPILHPFLHVTRYIFESTFDTIEKCIVDVIALSFYVCVPCYFTGVPNQWGTFVSSTSSLWCWLIVKTAAWICFMHVIHFYYHLTRVILSCV